MSMWTPSTNQVVLIAGHDGTEAQPVKVNTVGSLSVNAAPTLYTVKALTPVKVDISTATTTAIVAAVAAATTRVHRILLFAAAAQTVQFKDGATLLTGPMAMAAGGSMILDLSSEPWFKTSTNTAFNLTTTTTGNLCGQIEYVTG